MRSRIVQRRARSVPPRPRVDRSTRVLPADVRAALPRRGRTETATALAAARRFGEVAAHHDVDLDSTIAALRRHVRLHRRRPWRSAAVVAAVAEGWVDGRLGTIDSSLVRLQRHALDEWTRRRANGTDPEAELAVLVVTAGPALDAARLVSVVQSACRSGESIAAVGHRVLVLTERGVLLDQVVAAVTEGARSAGAPVVLDTWPVSAALLLDPSRVVPCTPPRSPISRSGGPRPDGATTPSWPSTPPR